MVSRKSVRRSLVAASVVVVAACQDAPPAPMAPSDAEPALSRAAAAQQAAQAFDRASAEVLALPGTVFADYDERVGRLVFGVENSNAIVGVRTALTRLGLSSSTYDVQITEPIVHMATLRDKVDPKVGGLQIHFGQYLCTLGFNATDGTEASFITNSHCTNTQGGVEGTVYYQPTSTVAPTSIATEVEDPTYFKGGVCPRGKKCRFSDASRARYHSGVTFTLGGIARTTGANNGSLTIDGSFSISGKGGAERGTVVNKVGRTTGWTRAAVTRTCVNTGVSGSQIVQLCQSWVEAGHTVVGSGDSGSQVFTDNGTLVGLLWGGSSSGTTFIFSPLSGVERELGTLTVR
ncbi:MAG: S1 family peptidase [Gemmatimonadota bacterium]|nr:S1 family peptidase [Gemmatimonadota bacterium]